MIKPAAFGLLAALALMGSAHGQTVARPPNEAARPFAERVLKLPSGDAETHVIEAKWNGVQTVFADYAEGQDRKVVALRPEAGGYRRIEVTTGEEEGGLAEVAAIGFANADHDAAKELIVILTWPVQHADVSGTLYEVRLLDDAKPGQSKLVDLKAVDARFTAHSCDCNRSAGKPEHFAFKSIAAVKAELKRLGY